MGFQQIHRDAPEPLKPIAVLRLEPEDFNARWGIEFQEGSDGLDFTRSALIRLDSGVVLGLLRYMRAPEEGTELHGPAESAQPEAIRREFLAAFGLDTTDLRWVSPEPAVAQAVHT